MSTTHTLTWTLIPKRKGKLQIPSLKIRAKNKSIQSQPIIINVLDRNVPQNSGINNSSQQYYIEANVDNLHPYRGEQIILTYTLYTKVNLSSFDIGEMPRMKGFWSQDLYTPRNLQFREVVINKDRWYAATVKEIALFPTKSGNIPIEPATVIIGVKSGQKRRSLDFFSDPFFSQSKQVTLLANSLDINVKSLPLNNGVTSAAVGEWSISSKIDRISVKENEAVTMSVIINGTGNLKSVDVNDILFPSGLETFEPKIKIEDSPFRDKLGGKKTIEYVLIPRKKGKVIIPEIELTYFDLKEDRWKTKRSNSIRLNVIQNEKSISTAIGLSKKEVALVGKDIRFVNIDSPHWQRKSIGLITTESVVLFSIAIFIFLLPTTINLRKMHLDSTINYRIAKSALKITLIELKNISNNKPELIYKKIHSSMNIFISKKLNKTIERSSKEIIEICHDHNINDIFLDKLSNIMEHADAVRYAPESKLNAEADLKKFKDLILKIDRNWA